MGSYPSLSSWVLSDLRDPAATRAAITEVEGEISIRNKSLAQNAAAEDMDLRGLMASLLSDSPLRGLLYRKDGESIVIAGTRITALDAQTLLSACAEEPRVAFGGRSFVRMSDPGAEGIVAMSAQSDGTLVLLRATVGPEVLEPLVTRGQFDDLDLYR